MRGATLEILKGEIDYKISIHAPREGSDCYDALEKFTRDIFLSTLPVRGATKSKLFVVVDSVISIHAPREGSDAGGVLQLGRSVISIHAPREGSDLFCQSFKASFRHFYPRSP